MLVLHVLQVFHKSWQLILWVLTVWLPPAVDAKDLDPDLEHEKSVPTVEALLALNLKGSAVNVEPFHKSVKFLPEIGFSSWWEKAFMIEVFFDVYLQF